MDVTIEEMTELKRVNWLKCPKTNKDIPLLPEMIIRCPHCKKPHVIELEIDSHELR